MEYKKISVLVVTYRQQDVISRNIESILKQKEYGLHEIVICDDCSPDNNWDVIQSYVKKYPEIIRAYRNNPNLGIYGNSDKCASLHGEADLFCWLEGDDALCDGFFKAIQEAIVHQNIDVSKPVGIQGDYEVVDSIGNIKVVNNSYLIYHHCNPYSAKIRALTSWRASVFSKPVIDAFCPTLLDKGLALAESLFDSQWFRYAYSFYHIHAVGSVYYSGIGVSVDLQDEKKSQWLRETKEKWEYLMNNVLVSKRDKLYAKSQIKLVIFKSNYSLLTYFSYLFYYVIGNIGYGSDWRSLLGNIKKVNKL